MARMKFPIAGIDLYTSVTDVPGAEQLGSIEEGVNGKAFAYALAGGSALVVGNLLQAPAIDTQFDDMAVPAAVAAATAAGAPITITNGTTTVAAGDFRGGTLTVSVTPGLAEEYTIIDHGTATSGSAWNLYLDRPIRTAWTTSTKVTVRKNGYGGVIQMPTTPTAHPVGVAIYAIPASAYGYIQVRGTAGVLSDNSTGAIGSDVSNSTATAGAVGVAVTGTTRSLVGTAQRALSSAKAVPVFLKIC
ncbi:MAG TPA: hypothetical protein VF941_02910 [Clostridia bacterium]